MTDVKSAAQFVGDIPKNYDEGLGPNIFEGYAEDIAARAANLEPSRVLELAAGTGIVSRKLRDRLPKDTELVVTDLNPPMLDVARKKFRPGENVEFAQADAMKLDYRDGSFDLIVCQFGVMFFPDRVASYGEALRVLRPGGAYLFNAWGTKEENQFSKIANDVVVERYPDDPPGFYKVPFSYADASVAKADLKAAGFTKVEHTPVTLTRKVKDVPAFARGAVYGNPLAEEIRNRKGDPDALVREIESRFRKTFGGGDTISLTAHVYLATKG